MKEYVLNYYPYFKCVAGECKHTCCAGWKMNIDEQTLIAYKRDNSPFCKSLTNGINFKKCQFKVDNKGRCAFLNQDGLCEIIINLGEQSLCQVCRDHPRFRSFFNDRIEMGLGFCCEHATKIILSFADKIQPVLITDDGKEDELDFNEKNVLDFRTKALNVIQNRSIDLDKRIDNLLSLCHANIESEDCKKILKTYFRLERLDKSWTTRLKNVKSHPLKKDTPLALAPYAEQFLANSLFRHLYDAEDTLEVRAKTIACVFGWWLINTIFEQELKLDGFNFNFLIDVVRAYSAEIEYSQKNLDKLFTFAYQFIKV